MSVSAIITIKEGFLFCSKQIPPALSVKQAN
jgi:hypothetical protein